MHEESPVQIVVLAAGQGTRMRSQLPKVLHRIAGQPLLQHVLNSARALQPSAIHVVYGHGGEQVRAAIADPAIHWVLQDRQLGTGHAVQMAMPHCAPDGQVLVLYGDVPLLRPETLQAFLDVVPAGSLGLMTAVLAEPSGYGRIVRDAQGSVERIVEEKDADAEIRAIREVNTGIMVLPAARLGDWLARLENGNAQGEYYLTDVVALARREGLGIAAYMVGDPLEVAGVNNKAQLAELEREYQRRRAQALMLDGVLIADPARVDIRGEVEIAPDVRLEPNVILEGRVRIGAGSVIGMGVLLRDVEIGENVQVLPYSVVEAARIGDGARVGPFARVRPGTALDSGVHVGNFVEIKASRIGQGSKANHLSYIGDAEIGAGVNIGAGTITCNYDGANKHKTIIEDDAFIGSDTQLVAPVRVGRGATIGAGSTITREAPAGELTLSRVPQRTRTGWQRPKKKE
ncbi:MAG: bifunctional UDP-N-acetylglucosamine diphosphorylase/glucosamine-1-phosphate N-acetyltransferase GlmU [Pseudomonadota bacterium]